MLDSIYQDHLPHLPPLFSDDTMAIRSSPAMAFTQEVDRSIGFFSLPAEIRNQIYALAVVEDEPVIAYVDEKPVRRSSNTEKHGRLTSKSITHPALPGIAYACRQTYQEATPFFFGKNTFILSEKTLYTGSFLMWQTNMILRHRHYMTTNLRRMIIEFPVQDLSERWGEKHAGIEAKLCNNGQIEVRFGGALTERCICRLLDHLSRYNAQELDSNQSMFAPSRLLEYIFHSRHLRKDLNCSTSVVTECINCGKPRVSWDEWGTDGSRTSNSLRD